MKPNELAVQLNIRPPTLRLWAGQYNDYLSPSAQGRNGRHRVYSDLDVKIFAYIQRLKDDGYISVDIFKQLDVMKASEWKDLPEIELISLEQPAETLSVVRKVNAAERRILEMDRNQKKLLIELETLRVVVLIALMLHLYHFTSARSKLS